MSSSALTLITITEPHDDRVADYVRLRDVSLRRSLEAEHGLFIAEGEKVIRRALEAGYPPRSFLLAPRWLDSLADALAAHPDVPIFVVSEALAEEITGFHVHRGALASMRRVTGRAMTDLLDLQQLVVREDVLDRTSGGCAEDRVVAPQIDRARQRSRIAVLEDLVDHTNVGACFRSAAALGVDAVLVTPRCADPLYRRSIKVSMGTVFQVPWARVDSWPADIRLLKEAGYVVAGMTLGEGAITLDELVAENHQRLALVFGTEGHGLTAKTDRLLDRRVTIPMMHGVDSLNVAASSAVAFYATR
ncbi:RNA methyltransferase [Raineyella sp. LH-20]|uniref:TrmH family RNA methyltransferase n=1 Tax=Raineyella sp. LH-20 TaxID=3081204 RepID=UPI002952A3BE|nr:RNA methyltransferase [Raineyella sp. LH-20]WOP18466.1 RNA methyltransferase [Raineyella sp. LH-20]